MPILETKILGSDIEINYPEGEKGKLINLIEQFNLRLFEFKDLRGKFTDNKIILLAALKAEDDVIDLNKRIESQIETKKSLIGYKDQIDNQTKEIAKLMDQISNLHESNKAYKKHNEINTHEINLINKKLILLIDKILNNNDNDKS